MADNYWVNFNTKEPCWSGANSVPKSKKKETHYIYDGRNFAETLAKVEKFCSENDIKISQVRRSYGNWSVTLPESDESFNKRVETWKREREKYKILREKWLAKKKQEKKDAESRQVYNTNDEFVVVRLTPAQYKKLMANT